MLLSGNYDSLSMKIKAPFQLTACSDGLKFKFQWRLHYEWNSPL